MEKKNTHIAYGFITGIVMVIIGLIIYLVGAAFKPGMQYVSYIPFLAGIILNSLAYSKANDGYVTFGNVFGSGFKASMIVTIVIVIWSVASMAIFPEMKEKAMNMAREQMAKNPKVTDEQIESALNITKKYWTAFLVAGATLGTLFYGAIFAVVGAMIAKKKGEKIFTGTDNF